MMPKFGDFSRRSWNKQGTTLNGEFSGRCMQTLDLMRGMPMGSMAAISTGFPHPQDCHLVETSIPIISTSSQSSEFKNMHEVRMESRHFVMTSCAFSKGWGFSRVALTPVVRWWIRGLSREWNPAESCIPVVYTRSGKKIPKPVSP